MAHLPVLVACNRVICKSFPGDNLWNMELIGIQPEKFTCSEQLAVDKVVTELEIMAEGYMVKLPFLSNECPSTNIRMHTLN